MKSFKNMLLYCGLSREEYKSITPLIAERNAGFSNIVPVAMILFGTIFLINALLSGSAILFPYLFLIFCGGTAFIIARFVLKTPGKLTLPFCYLEMSAIFIFAIILSSQGSNRENPSTSIIVFLALLPLTINDRPARMFTVVAAFSAAYLIRSAQAKVPDAHTADIMNTLTFSIIGMAVYLLVSNRNVHEIYLRQVAVESDRLREEKRAADMANAAKSVFLANMSHEIRTPINAILGMNEIVLRESRSGADGAFTSPAEAADAFRRICSDSDLIRSAGHNLLSLVNDILDFSKIEAGKMELVESEYDLSSVLNDVSSMIAFKARGKGLDFHLQVDQTLPSRFLGDEVRVRQIITNVLNNAVKYTESGSVLLTVGREVSGAPAGSDMTTLVISVRDTGIGIREEDMGKLFARFERVDLRQNSTVEGTGLGLAIARSLLDMMGGSIRAESAYGSGSTFTILLPQKVVSREPIGDFQTHYERNAAASEAYRESFHAPDAEILIVDDTRMNIKVALGLLQHTQLRIDAVESGAEAVALCRGKRYDLILMDQRMPQMDGTEAMRIIRTLPDALNKDTPFICLTADAVIGARERYLAEGFADYLSKPVNGSALESMLLKHLPPEKVSAVQTSAQSEPGSAPIQSAFSLLRTVGIDPLVGLNYCQNDPAFYESILREYAQSAAEKSQKLEQAFAEQDWKNYGIFVHALRSTSRFIGAGALSDAAAALEDAAGRGDAAAILAGHADMMGQYTALRTAISSALGAESAAAADDDEILEFMPE